MARLIAGPMRQRFSQPVVVENAAGASGNIGAARVARAGADGHTALLAHVGVLAINRHLFRNMPFDAERDFVPVGLVCTNPMALLVSTRSGIPDLAALIARAQEGRLKVATSGNGSTLHIGALQFLAAVGGRADLIPYRGGAPAVNDLLAGVVDMLVEQAASAITNQQGGMARAFFVTGSARLPGLPNVPTAAEAGLPAVNFEVWNGVVLPAASSPAVAAAWNAALTAALTDSDVRSRLVQLSARLPEGQEGSPAHLGDLIRRDGEKWGRLLRETGVQPGD
ncbi:Bug family tripartite tricarboxylate transporter substrate binding protein [Neoroseomonas eburnea]|nr:tripartite tricarboxylate transporter substrate binding protein [Neoroseomonas eburnea]